MPSSCLTAAALSRAYAAGAADPVAIAEAALSKALAAPTVFLTTTPERARSEAAASARRWREGRPLSALDGVPVAWKDLFDVAGTVTTAGSAVFAAHPPARDDALLVAAGTRAGMVCIGKTGLSEFAYSGLGLNPHFGTATNPALEGGRRAPGGSSSGAAIAVATGIVPIAVGTDTGGSIRVPSAFNGLTGYRASGARYSREGMVALSATLDTCGPLAANVSDCIAFDAAIRAIQPPSATDASAFAGTRFIVDPNLFERYAVTPAVGENFERFVARLEEAGAVVERKPLAVLAAVSDLVRNQGWLGGLEAFAVHRALLDSPDATRIDPRVRARLEANRSVPAERIGLLIARRAELISAFARETAGATLVMPTVAHVAPLLGPLDADPELFARVNLQTLAMTMLGSFLDTPAVAMPSGIDADGLSTSVQIMRPQGDDDALLRIAAALETKGL
ncbi:amidase [Pararobbsia alpina]|uniref:2-amino-5-chloromuconic acid deaminase n=1 Tax=Pararobbsia alpina TaxID=621374 RepID=A0A6S7BF85_9BURK|nr:amidase [Pararobbsia alpina]CAB3798455.1 2-amino-5-chloromuconic acid deaminase [Pararobbsia alpina]